MLQGSSKLPLPERFFELVNPLAVSRRPMSWRTRSGSPRSRSPHPRVHGGLLLDGNAQRDTPCAVPAASGGGRRSRPSPSRGASGLLTSGALPRSSSASRGPGSATADALRSDRARARAAKAGGARRQGYLKSRSISAKTLHVYTEAVKLYYLFCRAVMMPVNTFKELDAAMEQCLHKLYFDGETISKPNNTVHGLMYEQNLTWSKTSEFPLTRKALQGYRKSSRTVSRDGAPWECAILLASFMAKRGSAESIQAAGLTLLMFDTYLRISEGVSLGRDQVVPPQARSGPRSFYSLIVAPKELGKPTKAGAYDDTVLVGETAPERRAVLRAILAQLVRATKPGEFLFPDLTAAKYELIFRRACVALGFDGLKLCPHSLRHGGASVDALNGIDTITIQKRGRWNVIASCRRYEKKGRILKQLSILGAARVQESTKELAWLVSKLPALLFSAVKGKR